MKVNIKKWEHIYTIVVLAIGLLIVVAIPVFAGGPPPERKMDVQTTGTHEMGPVTNNPPNIPTVLVQYMSDGTTGIPIGGTTNEGTIIAKGGVSDSDNNSVQLEVETQLVGISFANTPNCVSGPAVASGSIALATCSGLTSGQYHWQARAKDENGSTGGWLSAGGNPETSPDFIVNVEVLSPYVFVRGTDNAIWYRAFFNNKWGDWQSIGGITTSDPDASYMCSRSHCYVHVFVRGTDNALWAKEWDYGGAVPFWRDWISYGGILTSSPGVATVDVPTGNGPETYIFVRGTDNALWYKSWRTEGNWAPLGGILTSGPGSVGLGSKIYIFVKGTDNAAWYRIGEIQNDLSFIWTNWATLGGNIVSDPDATTLSDGKIAIIVRGTDDAIWYRLYDGTTWANWATLNGRTLDSPGGGYNDVFVRGTDNTLWRKEFGTPDWINLGGILNSGPGSYTK